MVAVLHSYINVEHGNLNVREWVGIRSIMGDMLGTVPPTTLEVWDRKPLPDYFPSTLPVASKRLCDLFISLGIKAEFFPVVIQCTRQPAPTENYLFMNVCEVLDCVDAQRSVIKTRPPHGIVDSIEKLALRPEADAADCPAYRLKGLEWIVCVSEAVRSAVEASRFVGLKFIDISKYVHPMFPSPDEYAR